MTDPTALSPAELAEKVQAICGQLATPTYPETYRLVDELLAIHREAVRRASERDQAARPFLMTKEGTFTRESVEALAAEARRLRDALEPFVENWDFHACDYLANLVDGAECRIIEASVVDDIIAAQRVARSALAAGGGEGA